MDGLKVLVASHLALQHAENPPSNDYGDDEELFIALGLMDDADEHYPYGVPADEILRDFYNTYGEAEPEELLDDCEDCAFIKEQF